MRAGLICRRGALPLRATALSQALPRAPKRSSTNIFTTFATSAPDVAGTSGRGADASPWRVKMLYDGDCPLCMREVEMLQRRDAGKGAIAFVDIASPEYDPAANAGISFRQAMERIHAILPDGTVLTDVEVFRRLYEEVGLGWVYAVTRIPAVERAANAVYNVWAKYRLPLTSRPDLEVVLAEKRACGADGDSACEVPAAAGKEAAQR